MLLLFRRCQRWWARVTKSWSSCIPAKKLWKPQWLCVKHSFLKETTSNSAVKIIHDFISFVERSANHVTKKWRCSLIAALVYTMLACFARIGTWWRKCLQTRPSRLVNRWADSIITHAMIGFVLYCNVSMGSEFARTRRLAYIFKYLNPLLKLCSHYQRHPSLRQLQRKVCWPFRTGCSPDFWAGWPTRNGEQWRRLYMHERGQAFPLSGRRDIFGIALFLAWKMTKLNIALRGPNWITVSGFHSLCLVSIHSNSRFHAGMVDSLNAEISLGTVSNVRDAVQWLGYTYLFVRMKMNPFAYGRQLLHLQTNDLPKDPKRFIKRDAFGWSPISGKAQRVGRLGSKETCSCENDNPWCSEWSISHYWRWEDRCKILYSLYIHWDFQPETSFQDVRSWCLRPSQPKFRSEFFLYVLCRLSLKLWMSLTKFRFANRKSRNWKTSWDVSRAKLRCYISFVC